MEAQLRELLGDEDFLKLVENYGGIRLFVPSFGANEMTNVERVLGADAARKLAELWGGDYLVPPLARTFRAIRYQRDGLSNAKIAQRLGITESGVVRIFSRENAARRVRREKLRGGLDTAGSTRSGSTIA
ncbi:hypothetical protein GCM10011491_07340 [Brucella endophytica]|uniref:Mor transcription activator domain-containing protein n=2 Tax=Brucella endophytica TaxID=1963359 RepID=A0A916S429_9HYPH|nr:hypothetical protein GCM10011491_07340 [Brucella endophytica]